MSDLPTTTPINPKHHRKLLDIKTRMAAVQQSMQMFQSNCEQRLAQLQHEGRAAWGEIKAEHGINLDGIVWEPHPTEPSVVPTQMRLQRE